MRARSSHATVVAYVALVVALGGTGAWAADKITSKEIAKNAVRAKHIKQGQVKAEETDLIRRASEPATVPGGPLQPLVTLDVNALTGDLIKVYGSVELRRVSGPEGCSFEIESDPAAGNTTITSVGNVNFTSSTFNKRYVAPHPDVSVGTFPVVFEASAPGTHRFRLLSFAPGGTTCEYRNRNLWAELLR